MMKIIQDLMLLIMTLIIVISTFKFNLTIKTKDKTTIITNQKEKKLNKKRAD